MVNTTVPRLGRPTLPGAAGAMAAAVVAVGLLVHETTGRLGSALPPFVSAFGFRAEAPATAIAVALLTAAVVLGPRLLAVPRRPAAFALALFVLALALGLSISAVRNGTSAWHHVFQEGPGGSFEAKNEYLPALPAADHGIHYLLDRFALLIPALPSNASAHPPGLLIVLHLGGIDTARGMAWLCIGAAAAIAPLTYALGRAVWDGEREARVAALLAATSPVVLLFAFTSADAVFAALGTATAALLARRRGGARVAGAALLAVASLFSWALLAVGAWAALLAWRRGGWRDAARLAALCAIAVLGFQALLAVVYGYDPLAELQATHDVYRNSLARIRPYWFWVLGSPVAWGVMLGLPIVVGWLRATERGQDAALALAGVIVVAAVAGFTKAEVERIWLPFAPLACVAAAPLLAGPRLRPALALLAVQALGWQLLFATIW